ncbi:MAG: flagellar motor protein MotD [Oxalobacter sp.]|nr:MAG: flagellar motor protein MotD [Oxalobacter sp.]
MARKKREEEHENHERWMVSYADFITLLFAFFVVMYSLSSINEGKYRTMSNSILQAFGKKASVRPMVTGNEDEVVQSFPVKPKLNQSFRPSDAAIRREKEQMTNMAQSLMASLAPLVSEGKVRVMQTAKGINVEINASVLFAQGQADLNEQSKETLQTIARVLKSDTHIIQVEGHTDNVPISNEAFPSNWELSSVRASSVIRLLIDSGVSENRLQAAAYAATIPIDSNDTEEGRQRNRRVQLMILSELPETIKELPLPFKKAR